MAGTLVRIGLHHHDGGGEGSAGEAAEAATLIKATLNKGAVALPEGAHAAV